MVMTLSYRKRMIDGVTRRQAKSSEFGSLLANTRLRHIGRGSDFLRSELIEIWLDVML